MSSDFLAAVTICSDYKILNTVLCAIKKKGLTRDPCGGGNILYLDCGGGDTNIHMVKPHRTKHTHIQISKHCCYC